MARFVCGVKKFFVKQEEGASLAEYALLLALITVAVAAAVTNLGNAILAQFNNVIAAL